MPQSKDASAGLSTTSIQEESAKSPRAPATSRENNFDLFRLLLAMAVIFSHAYPLGTGSEEGEPLMRLTRGQSTLGTVAVDLFFMMSGYLITASFLNSSGLWAYMSKRVRRIYPGFIVAMLFGVLVILPLSGGSLNGSGLPGQLLNFVGNTLRLQEFRHSGTFAANPRPDALNGSVWSIAYEFWCYIGVVVLGLTGILARRRLVLALFLSSILVSIVFNVKHLTIFGSWLGLIFGYPPFWARLLPMFTAGIIAYLYRDKLHYGKAWGLAAVAALLGACFVPFAWDALFPLCGGYILFWAAFNPWRATSAVAKNGDFSYGTYLYAFPVEQVVVKLWGGLMNPALLFSMTAPIALLLAAASWQFVERPFLVRKTK